MEYDPYIWTMRSGDTIQVKDMSSRHIRNCIEMLIKTRDKIRESLMAAYSISFQGEMTQYSQERDIDRMESVKERCDDWIKVFKEELEIRPYND